MRIFGIGEAERVRTIARVARRAVPLLAGAMLSCDDGPAAPEPASLSVTPASVSLASLGDTAVFSAVVSDQYGDAFPGAVEWTTSQPSVFSVTPRGGVVEALGNGEGLVMASFRGLSATANVTVAQAPASVEVASGDGQSVRQGLALREPVVVQVSDAGGSPVGGVEVVFVPADGDGSADPGAATTGADGRAETSWTLGDHSGAQSLTASVAGAGGLSTQAGATALTPEEAADSIRVVAGDQQRGLQGRALRQPVAALVLDDLGEPVPGARVAFATADGHGAADPDTASTGPDGRARTTWTLGDRPGPQSLAASVAIADGPSTQAGATGLTPEEAADSIRVVAGDQQRGLQGRALRQPVVALVLDDLGEPVPGARVAFATADGHGAADPDTAATGDDGRAHTTWTLGDRPGAQSLAASVARADGPSTQAGATGLTPEEAADSIRLVAGDQQSGLQGRALRQPVVALVLDDLGEPVPGARVAFAPADGHGAADPDTAATGDDGIARTTWTLGDRPGLQSLAASVARADGPSTQAGATALTPEEAADSIRVVAGDQQSGLQGRALRQPVAALVLDDLGEPVPGARVAFAPADGHGAADPDTVATDPDGIAHTLWTLGDRPGPQSLAASVAIADGPSTQAGATALTPEEAADSIRVVAGDQQHGLQGRALRQPVAALVLDDLGEPVPGARVAFATADGHGAADPDTASTGPDGIARTTWTLGDRPGPQSLAASVAIADGPSTQAGATALTPEEAADSIRVVAGDQQRGLQGRALRQPVVALVLDDLGEPVPGARVAFAPADGHGAADPDTVATDPDGRAHTTWTLGDRPGPQSLAASVARPGGPAAQAAATALTPEEAAASIEIASGDRQRARQGTTLLQPVAVRVLDADGHPVPGARVAFAPADGHGAADPDTAATGPDGRARTTWTLGDRPGTQSLAASVAIAGGPAVQAAATALTPEEAVAAIEIASGDGQRRIQGRTLVAPIVARVLDQAGAPVPGVRVTFAPAPNNGSVNPSSARTDAGGLAETRWTLGEPLGQQSLVATAAEGPSVRATATAVERPRENTPPQVTARVPTLVLQVGGRSGVLAANGYFSDADGDALRFSAVASDETVGSVVVRGGAIEIGPASPGSTQVRIAAADADGASASQTFWITVVPRPDASAYNIHVADFTGLGLDARGPVVSAVQRWEQAIAGNLPSVLVREDHVFHACRQSFVVLAELDDLVAFALIGEIDGPGGTLAVANQCVQRHPADSGLPVFGFFVYDAADLDQLQPDAMHDVTLHELGHVLGIGTLWSYFGFLQNPSWPASPGADTHFTGPLARAAFDAAGGTGYTGGSKVPVDNRGIPGSGDVHWRQSIFGQELMDGFIYPNGVNPLSAVTIQSLADMGYTVDASAADAWTFPVTTPDAAAAVRRGEAIHLKNDVARGPVLVVDRNGRILRSSGDGGQ